MVAAQRTTFSLSLLLLLVISAVEGQDGTTTYARYTLADLEEMVFQNDAGVASLIERVNETRGELGETRSRYGPVFTTYYSRYPSGGDLPEEENVSQWLSVGLRQDVIELFKVRPGRIRERNAGVEGAEAALEEARIRSLYELRRQYLELVTDDVMLDYCLDLTALYQEMFEIQNARYVHQTALLPDLLEARKRLIEAESLQLIHQSNLRRGRILLAGSIGIAPEELIVERPDLPMTILPEEELIDLALRNRGEIQQLEANARLDRARASTSTYDDIRLSAFVGYRLRDDRFSSTETGLGINVTFSMPLQFRGIRNNRHDRFSARERFWRSESERSRLRIKREIRKAYTEYSVEKSRHEAAVRSIVLTTEQLRIEQLNFENPIQGIASEPAAVLEVKAELATRTMENEIRRCGMAERLFELLCLAGLSHLSEISREVTEIAMPDRDFMGSPEDKTRIEPLEATWNDHFSELPPISQFSGTTN